MIKLRKWQSEAVEKCLKWYSTTDDKRFVINAAPGTGCSARAGLTEFHCML